MFGCSICLRSLTFAEARKGYVGGAPVVLVVVWCMCVLDDGWCDGLWLFRCIWSGLGLWGLLLALVPISGLDLGYLGCAAGVSFGCVDSMVWIGVAWVFSPRGFLGCFGLIW